MSESINRPLKFRAWQPQSKRMYYEIDLLSDGLVNIFDEQTQLATIIGAYRPDYTVIEIPVMQFTDYTDSVGKEIWEGDIIDFGTYKPDRYEIQFNDSGFGWYRYVTYGDAIEYTAEFTYVSDWTNEQIMVIGNIYENPELLTGKSNGKLL